MSYTPNFAGVVEALRQIIANGSTGGGGGTGGATATNQQTQIQIAQTSRDTQYEIRDRLPVTGALSEGQNISGVSIPSGGSGARGWFSAIWKILSDRLPDLVGGRVPIDSTRNLSQIDAQTRAASGDFVIIPAPPINTQRIKVYALTLQLNGTSENLVIVRDGGRILGRHLLIARGDQSGFICDFPRYVTTTANALMINCSSASEVFIDSIFYEYF